jgi:membrane associated rhomboid family serine protease
MQDPKEPHHHLPIATLVVLICTAIGALLQVMSPAILSALRRDPRALAAGEWWRILSPLLVLDGNIWWHFAYDSLGLILVGVAVERWLGPVRWLILFLAGALAGEVAGYAWDPYGAGASIGLCGLIGGLVIWQIRHRQLHLIASIYAVGLAAALASEAIGAALISNTTIGIVAAGALSALLINLLLLLRRRSPDPQASAYYVGGVVMLGALVLTVLRDIHGVALLMGIGVAALLIGAASVSERAASKT